MSKPKPNPLSVQARTIAVLYWVIVGAFITLQPWGNIDTRDFSYMGDTKFWEYNAYIMLVLISMIVLGFLLWRGRAGLKSLVWIVAANTAFIVMCLFDMLHFFPDPAQVMPLGVWIIEAVDSILALAIIFIAPKVCKGR